MACIRKLFPVSGRPMNSERDRRVEGPIEVIERFDFAERGRLHAAFDLALLADD
jgi:hypothetical protein